MTLETILTLSSGTAAVVSAVNHHLDLNSLTKDI